MDGMSWTGWLIVVAMDEDAMQEAVDYVAVTRVQSAYADVVNRRAWDDFAQLFLPDCSISIDKQSQEPLKFVGPEQIGDFIGRSIEGFEFFEFVILNAHTVLGRAGGAPDTASSRMFMCELRQDRASGQWTNAFGVYHDQYRKVDGRWWFAQRHYQSLARTGRGDVFAFPSHPPFTGLMAEPN
jgi:SnoaL-like domain